MPSLGIENLLDWSEWFSDKELDAYVPEFIDSGRIDEKLIVFPVSKSTYAFFINGSQFARFSADTGVTYDSLSDWNSFFTAAIKNVLDMNLVRGVPDPPHGTGYSVPLRRAGIYRKRLV